MSSGRSAWAGGRARRFGAGLACALAAALLSCAPVRRAAYLDAFAAGERAYHAGRYREAAASFSDAAGEALRVKDRDEARLMEARSFQRVEAWEEARAAYARLVVESPSGPRTVRAEFEIAWLAIKHGDAEAGWAKLLQTTARHPEHGLARRALHELVDHEEQRGGPGAAVAWLRRHAATFRGTELDQMVTYEAGRALERGGDREGALRELVAAARAHPYPFGALTDDALLRAATIAEELGRPEDAIGYLREMIAAREGAATGSYERPHFDEAQMRIGLLYRDALGDRAAARRELHKLYAEHRASILRDDALWAEARLWRDDGDQDKACETAKLLARELPDSRYARCVHAMCPSVAAGPRACADYILRELGDATQRGSDGEPRRERPGEGAPRAQEPPGG